MNDRMGDRTLFIPLQELAFSGDPIPIVRDIEAKTRTRLKEGENPVWFIRLWEHFKTSRDPASEVSFSEFC